MPSHLSFEEASSCPTVFVTADFALGTAAGALGSADAAGGSVLVHAAAGGVGVAACQLAASHGLAPLATAGSPAKRAFVRGTGMQCVADSRSTTYVETLTTAGTPLGCGRMPVAVLNSLTSPGMIQATLACLGPGAAFVEISKRDIFSAARVSAAARRRKDMSSAQRIPAYCEM